MRLNIAKSDLVSLYIIHGIGYSMLIDEPVDLCIIYEEYVVFDRDLRAYVLCLSY